MTRLDCPTCGRDLDSRGYALHVRAHEHDGPAKRPEPGLLVLPAGLRAAFDSIPTPSGPNGPCRAYLATDGRDEEGRHSMWRVMFYPEGNGLPELAGPRLPWRDAHLLVRALNIRSGLQVERER